MSIRRIYSFSGTHANIPAPWFFNYDSVKVKKINFCLSRLVNKSEG